MGAARVETGPRDCREMKSSRLIFTHTKDTQKPITEQFVTEKELPVFSELHFKNMS